MERHLMTAQVPNSLGGRIAIRRIAIWCLAAAFAVIGVLFAKGTYSDFAQYWSAALDPSQYIKGGALVLLYAPLAQSGFPPFLAALLVNLASFLLLAWAFPSGGIATLGLVLIGLSWLPWSPLVNSDVPSAALLGCAVLNLLRHKPWWPYVLLAVGFSIRPQAMVLAGIVIACLLIGASHRAVSRRTLLFLALTLAAGWSLDLTLKSQSVLKAEILDSQRVPLYAGFLATAPGPACGEITPDATQAMRSDRNEPLLTVVRVPANALSLVFCKWLKMASYGASGSFWLEDPEKASVLSALWVVESTATTLLKLMFIILLIARRKHPYAALALLIVMAFAASHALLEIQPRYMIPVLTVGVAILLESIPVGSSIQQPQRRLVGARG